jgi:hypothetical protein
MLTQGSFKEVCDATLWNIRAALDLIAIHAEKDVRGRQPRASLNPFMVLAAAAAWERFLSDVTGAAEGKDPGHYQFKEKRPDGRPVNPAWEPKRLNEVLRKHGVLNNDITNSWEAHLADSWSGASPTKWRFVRYVEDSGSFDMALKNAQHARNGAAHFALPQSAKESSAFGYSWNSDADANTIQSGHARAVAALFLQLIDCSICAIASERGWAPERFEPYTAWFKDVVPSSDSRYPGVRFWGGHSLLR